MSGGINPLNIAEMMLEKLRKSKYKKTLRTNEEEVIVDDIIALLDSMGESLGFELEIVSDLVEAVMGYDDNQESDDSDEDEDFSEDRKDSGAGDNAFAKERVSLEDMTAAVNHWLNRGGKKRRKLSSVQSRYRFVVTSTRQLKRFKTYVEKGGTDVHKYHEIDRMVYEKFQAAKERHVAIHDVDLRQWAFQAAEELRLPNFKASNSWVDRFKARHSIVTRKITKFVTKALVHNQPEIRKSADEFVSAVKVDVELVGPKRVFNSDQSGIRKFQGSERTLDIKGVKKVPSLVQNLNATTHSYTVQPCISADGDLHSPTLLVLPEPKGMFGPIVSKNMFQASNLKVVATKSGKCDSKTLIDWKKDVMDTINSTVGGSVWLLDAFGGFNAATDTQDAEDNEEDDPAALKIRRIPKNTTGMVQPLDVYGFRPVKNFIRRISDIVILHQVDFELSVRDNIIKLQSLVWNQLAASRYREMWRMGWFMAGYIPTHPLPFVTPVQFCFGDVTTDCKEEGCNVPAVIRCSWCTQSFCMRDFLVSFHYCDVEN